MAGDKGSESAAGLVNTLQGHVDDIRTLIQCGICIRPLYEPFTLACGHTFCYSCLTSWFSGGRSKRTCPDCRTPVKSQPAPAYLVRAVVQMFTGRAELLDKGETTAEHTKNQREEAEKIDKDKANNHQQRGGLFGGLFRPKVSFPKPIIDVEDGVARCPHDSWELLDGVACTRPGCSYTYPPPPDSEVATDDSDDFSDEDFDGLDDPTDDDFDGDDDFGDYPYGPYGPYDLYNAGPYEYNFPGHSNIFDHLNTLMGIHEHMDDYSYGDSLGSGTYGSEDEDHYDDEDDMGSFIDDAELPGGGEDYDSESDPSTVVGGSGRDRPSRPPIRSQTVPEIRPEPPYVDTDDSEEDKDDEIEEIGEDEVNRGVRRMPRRRVSTESSSSPAYHDTRSSPTASSEPDSTDASRGDPVRQALYESTASSQGNEGSESPASSSSPPRRVQRPRNNGSSARNAIAIDDSDDGDDQPVGPMRTAQRRRARYSPY